MSPVSSTMEALQEIKSATLTPEALAPFRLSPSQYDVLLQLNQHPQLSSNDSIPVARSLEARGLIHHRQYKSGSFWFLGIAGQATLLAIATVENFEAG